MDSNALAPAIFSLLGVAVGAVGSLVAAFLATRTTKEQARVALEAELRAERKFMLLDYLKAAQEFHDYAARVWEQRPDLPDAASQERELTRLDSEMWLEQKKLLLVASPSLRSASLAWTRRLNGSMSATQSRDIEFWDFIEPLQTQFLDAARAELGAADDRKRPRISIENQSM